MLNIRTNVRGDLVDTRPHSYSVCVDNMELTVDNKVYVHSIGQSTPANWIQPVLLEGKGPFLFY